MPLITITAAQYIKSLAIVFFAGAVTSKILEYKVKKIFA